MVLAHAPLANAPAVLPQANDPCWCGSGRKYKRCHKRSEGRVLPGVVSPMRTLPASIARPPYADTGEVPERGESAVKSPDVIARMRTAGHLAAEILRLAGEAVRPGLTTDELDAYVHQLHIERNCYPSPLNYHHYPKSVCTSVNEVICHGIPDSRELQDGDIVNLDVTVYHDGVHGDTNATFFVGDVDPASRQLVKVTEEAMWHGIEAVKPGRPLSDIGRAIEDHAKRYRYGVIRAFIGHGIGEEFHGDIQVLHYYSPQNNDIMRPGMTFTIEPMISHGGWQHKMWDDDWTAVTADGKRTAQFEHTVLVTDDGFDVLTGGDGAVSPRAPWA
ncbi:type I methionyl aminopeptidase [Desertimonas flava]|uniref:type I methionyl aminopeptidase n=1 Tax=Desertimonas flava TaxID=2064846 RepID=UPI000E34153B|nr:type I methionyl aminopeptidase [Desertimonas flava]